MKGFESMIAIIDYDAGNIKSVEKAIEYLGEEAVVTRNPSEILKAGHVILPGVGSFGDAMGRIRGYGLEEVIHQVVEQKIPFLGICLGLQLMFESSEESPGISGLGILKGDIVRLPEKEDLKVPHIGWNSLQFPKKSILFDGIKEDSYVYFVHSYYLRAKRLEDVAAITEYGTTVHAAVEQGNVFACQFHPEKSSEIGLHILDNFIHKTRRES